MRKMLLRLWNDFKRGTVVALHCMNNAMQCNEMKSLYLCGISYWIDALLETGLSESNRGALVSSVI